MAASAKITAAASRRLLARGPPPGDGPRGDSDTGRGICLSMADPPSRTQLLRQRYGPRQRSEKTERSPSSVEVLPDGNCQKRAGEHRESDFGRTLRAPPGRLLAGKGVARIGGRDLGHGPHELAPDDVGAEIDRHRLVEGDAARQALAPEAAVGG